MNIYVYELMCYDHVCSSYDGKYMSEQSLAKLVRRRARLTPFERKSRQPLVGLHCASSFT